MQLSPILTLESHPFSIIIYADLTNIPELSILHIELFPLLPAFLRFNRINIKALSLFVTSTAKLPHAIIEYEFLINLKKLVLFNDGKKEAHDKLRAKKIFFFLHHIHRSLSHYLHTIIIISSSKARDQRRK